MTPEYLREALDYDPLTGIFIWKKTEADGRIGKIAGFQRDYVIIRIDGKAYYAHRLAWFYVYGVWPKDQIDHINRIKNDNRICNLREASQRQNSRNVDETPRGKIHARGVHESGRRANKYRVQIRSNGKVRHIGHFRTVEEASAAYEKELENILSDM